VNNLTHLSVDPVATTLPDGWNLQATTLDLNALRILFPSLKPYIGFPVHQSSLGFYQSQYTINNFLTPVPIQNLLPKGSHSPQRIDLFIFLIIVNFPFHSYFSSSN